MIGMADEIVKFTSNYQDLSTERGFQFEFCCDRCGNGIRSPFQQNMTGMAGGLLRGAANLFGGILGTVGDAAESVREAVGGAQHDAAFRKAVEAVRHHFNQCSRCGQWVCKEVCWNDKRGLCTECAPKVEYEVAAAQSEATIEQMRTKVQATDYTKEMNVVDHVVAQCPNCGADTQGGKFCLECGTKLLPETTCTTCGTKLPEKAKFCIECGTPRQ